MKKYEYKKILYIPSEEQLINLGQDGWLLAAIRSHRYYDPVYYFVREICPSEKK